MGYNVKNIIVGAAAFYVSVLDSTQAGFWGANDQVAVTLPALVAGTSAVTTLNAATSTWRHVGFTTDGVELAYTPDFGEVEVDQLMDAARMFKQGMSASVNTSLAEATLSNLLFAWGQPAATLKTDTGVTAPDNTAGNEELWIASGALLDEPVERSVAFVGPAPRSSAGAKRERLYHLRRALNVEESTHSLAKTDATTIPVSLRLLPDPYFSGREYGIIRDRLVT